MLKRFVIFSDTHGMHDSIPRQDLDAGGDFLICCGDFCNRGTNIDANSFLDWVQQFSVKFKHIIVVAGNHDRIMEFPIAFSCPLKWKHSIGSQINDSNIHYLENSGIKLDDITFWGSPFTPAFCKWAFQLYGDIEQTKNWELIPDDTNVLITHGPIYGINDRLGDQFLGDRNLLARVNELNQLKLHACGHIHDGYGHIFDKATDRHYVNAAICTEDYEPINQPIVMDLDI